MAKKFREVVNIPPKKLAEKIKGIKENEHPQTKGEKIKKGAKIAGLGVLEFISFAIKYGGFDNQLTRKLEKVYAEMKVGKNEQGQDKKFSSFIKKHPEFSSYMTWWLAILMVIGVAKGGKFLKEISDSDEKEGGKKEVVIGETKEYMKNYKDFKETLQPLTKLIVLDLVFKEGLHIENGMCAPYWDAQAYGGKGAWTVAAGLTVLDGKPVTKNTPPLTIEKGIQKSIEFLENKETYFFAWCYTVGFEKFCIDTPEKARAIGSIFYNSCTNLVEDPNDRNVQERNTLLRALYKAKGDNVSAEEVKAAFKKYPPQALRNFGKVLKNGGDVNEWADALGGYLKEGRGMYWRRWFEGQIAKGNISVEDLLAMPYLGGKDFLDHMGGDRDSFFHRDKKGNSTINDETLKEFKQWIQNPVDKNGNKITRKTVAQMLGSAIDSKDIEEMKESAEKFMKIYNERVVTTSLSDVIAMQAQESFDNKDYNDAIDKWNKVLAMDGNNAQIMDNLAVAYIRNEQYNMALNILSKIIAGGYTEQFKYAYYNIGTAYEGLGQIEDALSAYKNAKKYGNSAADKKISDLEGKTKKSKKTAYIQGSRRLNSKGYNVRKYTSQKRGMA